MATQNLRRSFVLVRLDHGNQSLKDRPRFQKRLDPERAEFAADAGVLESPERRLLVVQHAVDRHAPCEELRGDAARAPCIGSVHVGMEAEVCVVSESDRFVFVVIGDYTEYGTENLLLGDLHGVLDIDKHRWLHEVTSFEALRAPLAACKNLRAFFNAFADV